MSVYNIVFWSVVLLLSLSPSAHADHYLLVICDDEAYFEEPDPYWSYRTTDEVIADINVFASGGEPEGAFRDALERNLLSFCSTNEKKLVRAGISEALKTVVKDRVNDLENFRRLLGARRYARNLDSQSVKSFWDGMDAYFKRDYCAAWEILKPLADQGHPNAQIYVGEMLMGGGDCVKRDLVQAYMWLTIAKSLFPSGWEEIGVCAFDLAVIAPQLTAAQIEEAERLAAEWWPTSVPQRTERK